MLSVSRKESSQRLVLSEIDKQVLIRMIVSELSVSTCIREKG